MSEYSYFRAEGYSFEAIDTIVRIENEVEKMYQKLLQDYGADVFFSLGSHFELRYPSSDKVPDDFEIYAFHEKGIFAGPRPGTAAETDLDTRASIMDMLRDSNTLEYFFGCAEPLTMPRKELLVSIYSTAFVRSKSYVCEWNDNSDIGKNNKDSGKIKAEKDYSPQGSSCAISPRDNLAFTRLDGNFYIRVPNDAEGKPHFTPDDAVRVKYDEMLKIDQREYDSRHRSSLSKAISRRAGRPAGP